MRSVLRGATAIVGLAAASGAGYVSHRIREDALRVRHRVPPPLPMTVRAMSDTQVRLDPGGRRVAPALTSLGLRWEGGTAELGPVIAAGRGPDVTRRLLRWDGCPAMPGTPTRIVATPWGHDPMSAHGLPFGEITYPAPGGPTGAWWVDGPADTWAVIVHGRGADRAEGLRILRPLAAAGMPTLMIRYRNDPGHVVDGIARFGQSEWEDLAAAVGEAAARGAQRIVLVGISMGGAIVMSYLERRPHPLPVVGAILDSPVLSLAATIDAKAGATVGPLARLGLVRLGRGVSALRDGIDWSAIDYLSRAASHTVPTLLFHDRDDELIPATTSDAFAALRSGVVDYRVTHGAGHTLSWNADPAAYDAAVTAFIADR